MPRSSDQPLTYADAGVDIDRGNRLVERIKHAARSTRRDGVLAGIGGFGAAFELPLDRYHQPVLVSGTDGVGTKLRLAIDCQRHRGVGIDLVAMCVNDVLTLGAEPLYFLDYFATARLDEASAAEVVAGIADGCRLSNAALIGGETAEMPGMYANGDYDLAGFCVAVVEKAHIVDGARVTPGDRVLGIASSGAHANGFSLIRRVLQRAGDDLDRPFEAGQSLADVLLAPTRIYVRPLLAALANARPAIHALAHITGGGLLENLPRVLSAGQRAHINRASWTAPSLFEWIQEVGRIDDREMLRTFNCGIGFVVVVDAEHADALAGALEADGETVYHIGHIEQHDGPPSISIE